jgi:biotin transport system substrate-specific component
METCERYAESYRTGLAAKMLAALSFAVLTGIGGRLAFHLGFTPVPVTFQVLCVILSGLVLGGRWGAISQMQYLAMGAMGFPFFTGVAFGPAAFVGPTGGYLFGFIAGAYVCGSLYQHLKDRTFTAAWIAGVAGILAIYSLGAPWLACWLRVAGKSWSDSILGAWQLGVAPFIGIDLLKAAAASGLAFGGRSWRGLAEPFRNMGW